MVVVERSDATVRPVSVRWLTDVGARERLVLPRGWLHRDN